VGLALEHEERDLERGRQIDRGELSDGCLDEWEVAAVEGFTQPPRVTP